MSLKFAVHGDVFPAAVQCTSLSCKDAFKVTMSTKMLCVYSVVKQIW